MEPTKRGRVLYLGMGDNPFFIVREYRAATNQRGLGRMVFRAEAPLDIVDPGPFAQEGKRKAGSGLALTYCAARPLMILGMGG